MQNYKNVRVSLPASNFQTQEQAQLKVQKNGLKGLKQRLKTRTTCDRLIQLISVKVHNVTSSIYWSWCDGKTDLGCKTALHNMLNTLVHVQYVTWIVYTTELCLSVMQDW